MIKTDKHTEALFRDCGILSLLDGLSVYENYQNRSFGLNRFNSTFWERCGYQLRLEKLGIFSLLNILLDARHCLFVEFDADKIKRDRFIHELSVGMIEAIGYTIPRSETAKPVLIPSDVWRHAVLNWNLAQVTGAGFTFTYVQILIPLRSALLKENSVRVDLLPALGNFTPSELKRTTLGLIAAQAEDVFPQPLAKDVRTGRPTHKEAILQAFEEIEKKPAWSNKQMAHAVRERVKKNLAINSDDGLRDDAIRKAVAKPWKAFKERING